MPTSEHKHIALQFSKEYYNRVELALAGNESDGLADLYRPATAFTRDGVEQVTNGTFAQAEFRELKSTQIVIAHVDSQQLANQDILVSVIGHLNNPSQKRNFNQVFVLTNENESYAIAYDLKRHADAVEHVVPAPTPAHHEVKQEHAPKKIKKEQPADVHQLFAAPAPHASVVAPPAPTPVIPPPSVSAPAPQPETPEPQRVWTETQRPVEPEHVKEPVAPVAPNNKPRSYARALDGGTHTKPQASEKAPDTTVAAEPEAAKPTKPRRDSPRKDRVQAGKPSATAVAGAAPAAGNTEWQSTGDDRKARKQRKDAAAKLGARTFEGGARTLSEEDDKPENVAKTLYVKLPVGARPNDVQAAFERFGKTRVSQTASTRSFCFVHFESVSDLESAMTAGVEHNGEVLVLDKRRLAGPGSSRGPRVPRDGPQRRAGDDKQADGQEDAERKDGRGGERGARGGRGGRGRGSRGGRGRGPPRGPAQEQTPVK